MPALNLLTLFTLASVAIVTLSSGPLHAHALVADRALVARHVHDHNTIAKRKRGDSSTSGRCKPRPSSSLDTSLPTSTPPPPSPTFASPSPTSTLASPSPTSTTSSPAPSAPSSTLKKWGLAWGSDNQYLSNFASLPNVGFLYTWSAELPSTLPDYPAVQGMPMLWGFNNLGDFESKVVAGYASSALGYNEPNEPSQSYMDPQQAAILWQQVMNPLKDLGYRLTGPACTADDEGTRWYQDFFNYCQGNCYVDDMAVHFYTTNFTEIPAYCNMLHDTYGRDIWITEVADQDYTGANNQPDMNQVWDFAGQLVNFVESTEWVRGCAPFGALVDLQGVNENNRLLDTTTGYPTALGYYYFGSP